MQIRLEGTTNEINWALTLLKNTPEIKVVGESRFYQNRDGTYRQYIEMKQKPFAEMSRHWQKRYEPENDPYAAVMGGIDAR
jgi:7,8-dihydro-6-hydroxymethylpterin-pyrophosphokinase